jgi:hypothetical protein
MVHSTRSRQATRRATKRESRRERLESELEEGLRETFPASDALSVTEPAQGMSRSVSHVLLRGDQRGLVNSGRK